MIDDDSPLILTLGLDPSSFRRLDDFRDRYFPPERNIVPAHVSLFHHLPGRERVEIDRRLRQAAEARPSFPIRFERLKRLGRGFMVTVDAPDLLALRAELARAFDRWLTPQDRQPYRPHVTIMNKADPDAARAGFAEASATWPGLEGVGESLLLWHYRGGPWDLTDPYPFGGSVE